MLCFIFLGVDEMHVVNHSEKITFLPNNSIAQGLLVAQPLLPQTPPEGWSRPHG